MNDPQEKRLNALLSVYACEPNRGSEPGIGWGTVEQVSRFHDVWVITSEEYRPVIQPYVAKNPQPNVNWYYVDIPKWLHLRKQQEHGRIHYYLWQISAYFKGREIARTVKLDCVHHVTYGSYWTPCFLALLPLPFIWGPVGGGESSPRSFYRTFSFSGRIQEIIRDVVRRIAHFDPFLHITARRAKIALSTTEDSAVPMRRLGAKSVEILPNIALSKSELAVLDAVPPKNEGVFRAISAGRLLQWKGLHLGLQAFAELLKERPASEYWIFGDGSERANLEHLTAELGIGEQVRFWGNVSRTELLQKLGESDILLHPSLHDSGGYICLEAMAAGRPVVCLDLGGPGVIVTKETGVKIAAISPEQTVADLTKALKELSDNPQLIKKMGEAAKQRIQENFEWEKKGNQLADLYRRIY